MHRLPQQEPGEPLLARGADDQVGVGLPLGVEVLGDVLLAEGGGHLLQARPGGGPLAQQLAHSIGDLLPAPVADGDVDLHAPALGLSGLDGLIRRPALLGGLRARRPGADDGGAQALGQRLGQEVDGAHEAQAPAAGLGELVDGVGDDVQQGRELGRVAGEVVGAQQPQGDDLDPHLLGPPEELLDLVRAALVALSGPEAHGLGPAAVAVEDDTHVVGHRGRVDARSQPALVDVVEEVVACHAVFLEAPRWGCWGTGPDGAGPPPTLSRETPPALDEPAHSRAKSAHQVHPGLPGHNGGMPGGRAAPALATATAEPAATDHHACRVTSPQGWLPPQPTLT